MKKILLLILLVLSLSANATKIYVKTAGNDANTGISDAQALATVAHAYIHSSAGDSILFNRGDTWREIITPTAGNDGAYTYYGAYGTGAKPLFLGSKEENSLTDWVDQGGNIWQNSDAAFTVDVGNIVFNNEESCGVKIMSATPTLDAQGEFWYDFVNDRIRMYSVGNPASFYNNIECALKKDAMDMYSIDYVIFQNLDFRYWGSCVEEGTGDYDIFRDLDISYIGGSDQFNNYTVRFGNGLQIWTGHHDITIERCRINNIYDAGISPQGYTGNHTEYNFFIRNNIISNCEYGFEFYYRTGATVHDVYFENNTIVNSGSGFGHNQRPDGAAGHSVRIGLFSGTVSGNVYIRNNIFYGATEGIFDANRMTDLSKMTIDYNLYYQLSGNIGCQEYTANVYPTISDWQTAISQESHGLSADPLFFSTSNFHLRTTSPAKDAGLNVGLTTDYSGHSVPQGAGYDIGAYEYGTWIVRSGGKIVRSGGKIVTINQ